MNYVIIDYMKYDVAIIGGGPAGMISAGRAGELGARTILIEKNEKLGIKLLITGKGRCNITNYTNDLREFIKVFGDNGKFLYSALYNFGVNDIINFLDQYGVKTKVERGNRIFPNSDSAKDVLNALIKYMADNNVKIQSGIKVEKVIFEERRITKIILENKDEIIADKFIFCTGGLSYPKTGSNGEGFGFLKEMGHSINKLKPALTPILIKERIVKELEGLSLKNVKISIYKDNKKIDSRFGEALFTGVGMSGPIILDMSKKINQELGEGLDLFIDFKPVLDFPVLDKRIQNDFQEMNNKLFKNSLDKLLPKKLIPSIIRLSGISPHKQVNLVTKEERKKLVHLLKEFRLTVIGVEGFDKAIITTGGVSLKEVDPKTMKSKLINNLYFAGEILDLDGPTGGYNLQVCWSTGYLAGESTVKD